MKKIYSLLALVSMLSLGLVACDDDDDDVVKTPLESPTVENDGSKVSSLSFSWQQVAGATQYAYEIYDASGNLVTGGITTATSAIISGLKPSTEYTLKVWAYAALDGDKSTSPIATLKATTADLTELGAPVPTAACVNGRVSISWPEVENATGYKYSYTVDGEVIEGEVETNSLTLSGLAIGEYTIVIYSVSDDEAFSDSEKISLTFQRAKAEVWRKTGKYTSSALGKSFDADIVYYDDGAYSIEAPIGVEGYSFSFSTLSGSTEISAVDPYYTSGGYSYFTYSDEYYAGVYTSSGYSTFSGDQKSGEMNFYAYLYARSDDSTVGGGYDYFVWGAAVSTSLSVDDLVGSYDATNSGWFWNSTWEDLAATCEMSIAKNDDGTITISNFLNWGVDITATVDVDERTITIPVCEFSYYTLADASSSETAVVATINDDNTITISNYGAWYGGSSYIYAGAETVMTKQVKKISVDDLVGKYSASVNGSDYFSSDWSQETVDRTNEMTIAKNDDGTISISNFYDWGVDFTATVDVDARTITIAATDWYSGYVLAANASSSSDVVASIAEDGTITFADFTAWYGSYSYIDEGTTVVMTKQSAE